MNNKNEIYQNDLVSIVMPAYNCEEFIELAINSVINQTYEKWELNIVEDRSSDNTLNILKKISSTDNRINIIESNKNNGAALSRNKAIERSKGEFIAFLDSDDLWHPNKLELQLNYMKKNDLSFTCTSYNKIDEKNNDMNIIIKANKIMDYNSLLKTCPGNSTVVYNSKKIGKIYIENIRKRNDYLMWIKVIKRSEYLYGIDKVLSSHRIRKDSISSNKLSLIKYHWTIYRKKEKLSFLDSLYLSFYWIIKGLITKMRSL